MKNIAAYCLLLALGLSACATFQNPVNQSQLTTVEAAYGTALSIAVAYRDACAQRIIPSSCRPIVVQMQNFAAKAQGAIVAARTFVSNNPTLSAVTVLTAAQQAVGDFQAVQAQYGVK